MFGTFWSRVLCSDSGSNLKSKIQNLKWVGFLAILVLLMGCVGMVEAQQAKKVARIGILSNSPVGDKERIEGFLRGLSELGWTEGHNIFIEYRCTKESWIGFPNLPLNWSNSRWTLFLRLTPSWLRQLSGRPRRSLSCSRSMAIQWESATYPVWRGLEETSPVWRSCKRSRTPRASRSSRRPCQL